MIVPASTNAQYNGHIAAAILLVLMAVQIFIGGSLHVFLPDGGANRIANRDISNNETLIIIALTLTALALTREKRD